MEKKNKGDEIDLFELFLKGINIFRDNFWTIFIFFLMGIGLGLVHYHYSKNVFENKMVISSSILTKSYCQKLIETTNKYRKENNLKAISSQLRVTENQAEEIISLSIDDLLEFNDLKEQTAFLITVRVHNQDILPDLQKGLIQYLEDNEFVKVRVEQNKRYFEQTISKLEQEIKDMEMLKQKISTGAFFQSNTGNIMFDPTTVNSKILELTKEKINLENNLALVNSVQIIEGFTPFQRPSSPRLSVSLISGSLIGLFFVSFLIAFKSIRKIIRMADAAKQKT